jgi:hypothetical protein
MLRFVRFGWLLLVIAIAWVPAWAGDLVIYDDSSENGFDDGCTFGAAPDFAETAFVHSGTFGISFSTANFGAVSWCTPTTLSTTDYSGITLWVNGGASSGQDMQLVVGLAGNIVASASLDTLLGHAIAANTWVQVAASFDNAPTAFDGNFDQISIQSNSMASQPTVYFDDVSLIGRVSGTDWIFKSGFEGSSLPPPACGMTQEHDVTVGSMVSDRFTWCDSAAHQRVAVFAHNDGQVGPMSNGGYVNHGGALREFRYQMPNATTRVADVTTYGNGGYGGFGYVVSHTLNGFCNGDDSPLGYTYSGAFQRVFEGRHHSIFRFTQNYQRHCGPNAPATTLVPVTIDWVLSTGRDNPVWAITYDLSAITANFLYDDSRAPYGELNIDGDGFTHPIDGVAWGDKFKFTSTTAPLTLSSSWTWNVANTIPYVKEWIVSSDATMGLVQTQTIDEQDAGGARNPNFQDLTVYWGKTSADGNAGGGYAMPYQDGWPYQADNDSIGIAPNSNNNARMTWGTQYGFLGQSSYAANTNTAAGNDGPFLPGYPKKSYSVYVVLGAHSTSPVETQIAQAEIAQTLTMSATTGGVVTAGPAGINRADSVMFAPAGYNHVYGALAFAASADNQLDANVAVGSGVLNKPLLILSNYAGAYPTNVTLNGTPLTVDVDYFPSMRASSDELWITFNQNFSGATNHIQVSP